MFETLDILDDKHVEIVAAAIADCRIGLALQDVHDASHPDQILYSECLAQLIGPNGTIHGPTEFVPCLEALRETAALNRHVLGLVLDRLEADPSSVLACNLSAESLTDEAIAEDILDLILARAELGPRLVLELSQSEALEELSFAAGVIADLRRLGCRVALEGFGAGFASPRLVQLVEFDIVKIDKAFIQDTRPSVHDKGSFWHLAGFASCFAPIVVAEGVETNAQLSRARSAGVTHVQGNVVAFPITSSTAAHAKMGGAA